MEFYFKQRELKKEEIEWGLTPLYMMAIRDKDPVVWSEFAGMVRAIDDRSFDEALEAQRKGRMKK